LEIAAKAFCESRVGIKAGVGEARHLENGRPSAGLGFARLSTLFSNGAVAAKCEASFNARRRLRGIMQRLLLGIALRIISHQHEPKQNDATLKAMDEPSVPWQRREYCPPKVFFKGPRPAARLRVVLV
jgi:hypothetical protein